MNKDVILSNINYLCNKYSDKLDTKLSSYLNKNILPYYLLNDDAHNLNHAEYVISRSLHFADMYEGEINYNIVYTLAVYHDIAHYIDYKKHEQICAEKFFNDENLFPYFTITQRQEMREILLYHDTVQPIEKLNIYAKILRTADCDTDVQVVMQRLYNFRLRYYPLMTLGEMVEDSYKYFVVMYGERGLNINKNIIVDPSTERFKKEISILVKDKKIFTEYFIKINKISR